MGEPPENDGGVFASVKRLLKTILAIAQNRLELLLVEWREERWRIVYVLLLTGAVLILALMTLLVATIAVAVLCIKADRLDLLGALALLLLAATALCYWRLRVRLKAWVPFPATLAELKKDKACLDEKD